MAQQMKEERDSYKSYICIYHHSWLSVEGKESKAKQTGVQLNTQAASADKISSSAHHRGESLGVAASGDISMTCLNFAITSFIEALFLGSCSMQLWITSRTISSSLSLKDFNVGSTKEVMVFLSFKY